MQVIKILSLTPMLLQLYLFGFQLQIVAPTFQAFAASNLCKQRPPNYKARAINTVGITMGLYTYTMETITMLIHK